MVCIHSVRVCELQCFQSHSPKHSYQRCINRVSIKNIHVIPTALCGKMVEPQPQHSIWAKIKTEYMLI